MAVQAKLTVDEFDRLVRLPENAERLFEYIGGEVIEVPSNPYASYIAGRIFRRVANHVEENDLGYTTGEAGGYWVSGERYAPDVAFISKARQAELAQEGYNPAPPDLAVEVDFPSTYQSQENLRIKVVNYLNAGTMVWLIRPEIKLVEVYVPGRPARKVGIEGVLAGEDVLPGFTLAVKDIFPPDRPG